MKRLKECFVSLSVVVISLIGNGCSEPEPEDTGKYILYMDAQSFIDLYENYQSDKILIDIRDSSEYAVGHVLNAVNLPADESNSNSVDSPWCKELLKLTNNSLKTCLFIYGATSNTLRDQVGCNASDLGYGKVNTRVFENNDKLRAFFIY